MPQLIASVEGVKVKHIHLEHERTTLGRKHHNDIVLDSLVVSGDHCVFDMRDAETVTVSDLGSTNGTFVNGHVIQAPRQLADEDIVSVGNYSLQFLLKTEPAPAGTRQSTMTMSLASLGIAGTSAVQQASLKKLGGAGAGAETPLVKAVTVFGQAGVCVIAISHRREGYFVAHMGGKTAPLLNGAEFGQNAVALAHQDLINMAGDELEFFLK